ncbi:MAG TPA: ATP-binding protein [Jatrophihabitans sp.]
MPASRVTLIDEQLRWISLDGVVLDLASGDPDTAALSPRLHPRDARVASEIAAGAPVREALTTVDGRNIEIDAVPVRHGERDVVVGIARQARTDATDGAAAEPRSGTDRLAVEIAVAELVLAEESFRATFDQAPGAVAMVAGPGEVGGRFLRVNAAFARLLGYSVEELHLREIAELTHPDDRDLEPVAAGDGPRVVCKRYLHASGRPVQVEVRVSEVRDAVGVLSYFINHVVDVDAQTASERIRRDMVSTISHELRTPLTSVQGYLEMIAGEDFGALSEDQRRMIDIAIRNAARLEEFVADLLMLARLDAAELDPIDYRPVDATAVVADALDAVGGAITRRRHELRFDGAGTALTVTGDAGHLQRAVHSLLANAIKYTADGGRITVTVQHAADGVEIAVVDTGMGIDATDVALLGNRFFRGTDAHRRAIGGTGLGLAITKTIVERHGGRLRFESVPGQGSRFAIVLPHPGPDEDAATSGAGGA